MDDLEILEREFYDREPHELARALLGQVLVRQTDAGTTSCRIVEVEVYGGVHDPASHANTGKPTPRTEAMFGEPGTAYIYRSYGIHRCLNVVAPRDTHASAILIRAAEPLVGAEIMAERRGFALKSLRDRQNLLSGPGKLCQALQIGMELNASALDELHLAIAAGEELDPDTIGTTARIGLNPRTVGDAAEWAWRYVVTSSRHLSRPYSQ